MPNILPPQPNPKDYFDDEYDGMFLGNSFKAATEAWVKVCEKILDAYIASKGPKCQV